MKTWVRILLVVLIAALTVLLAYGVHKASVACGNPSKRLALKIADANGCIEFWVNRYQSAWAALLGAVAAVGAAMAAWAGVQRQVRQQGRAHISVELASWQERINQIERDLQEMQFAQNMISDAVRVEYDARLAGGLDKFEARNFARLLWRGGIVPFEQVQFTGSPRTSREFNRLTQTLSRVAQAQMEATMVLPELEEAFWAFHGFQSDMINAMSQREREYDAAQMALKRLSEERDQLFSSA